MKKHGHNVKLSLYIPAEILVEVLAEAERQGRPVGWIFREAVRIALPKIKEFQERSAA